jgi:hypothetical protein
VTGVQTCALPICQPMDGTGGGRTDKDSLQSAVWFHFFLW